MTSVFAAATDPTVPATAPPTTDPPDSPRIQVDANVSDVVRDVIDNLGNNAYQTGTALIVATIALVGLLNIKASKLVLVPTVVGSFWLGWLGWNTFTGDGNPLFPGDPSALKIWDVAFQSGTGFLVAVIVGCVVSVLLWRKTGGKWYRIVVVAGAVLGASFVYNLVESVRIS
jgi:hypothetical protein